MKLFHKMIQDEKPEGIFVVDRLRTRSIQKRTVIGMLMGVAFVGWTYVFFFSDIFVVNRLEIEGLKVLGRGEVAEEVDSALEKMRVWPFRMKNIFFIDENRLAETLKDKIFAQSVAVDKKYPNILRLIIKERQTSLVIEKNSKMWQIDRDGIIMREILDAQERSLIQSQVNNPVSDRSSVLPILEISHDIDPTVGNSYVTDFRVTMWLDTFKSLQDLGFGYRHATVESATSTKLILNMFEPYDVYIDIMEPVEPQIMSLYEFLRVKKDVSIKEYIDARIPGKIYYQ
jgi:hypothetical protein